MCPPEDARQHQAPGLVAFFRARQILSPHEGFIWAARVAGVMAGSDRYLDGVGGMDWKLAGLVPLVHQDGPDVTRSAAGRGGAEAVWLPTTLLPRFGVRWSAQDDSHITASYQLGDTPIVIRYTLDSDGHITSFVFDRWGDPDSTGVWAWHPFGGEITAQHTFGGLTIPSSGRLGWHFGTDRWPSGEFFRYQITQLRPTPDACGPPPEWSPRRTSWSLSVELTGSDQRQARVSPPVRATGVIVLVRAR